MSISQNRPSLPLSLKTHNDKQLEQVFLNLIINAEKEMKIAHQGGKLLIKTEVYEERIRISFEDDGPGISTENLAKIFDPFFTTRAVGQGTGLGLTVCHGIVTDHNGKIYAESKPGHGATFFVELPITPEEKQLIPAMSIRNNCERGSRGVSPRKRSGTRVLLVDDEATFRRFVSDMLTDRGFIVVTSDNAYDALDRMKKDKYDLILMDVKLPHVSGAEIYEYINEIDSTVARKMVFFTGDVMGEETRSFLTNSRCSYITKPFDVEQFDSFVDAALVRISKAS